MADPRICAISNTGGMGSSSKFPLFKKDYNPEIKDYKQIFFYLKLSKIRDQNDVKMVCRKNLLADG